MQIHANLCNLIEIWPNLIGSQQTPSMHHAQHVLGAPILTFLAEGASKQLSIPADAIPWPRIKRGTYSVQAETTEHATMLLPEQSDMYSLYVQDNAVFVRPCLQAGTDMADTTYLLQARWLSIAAMFPADTVLRCIVYQNKAGGLFMGIYDMLAFNAAPMHKQCALDRHALIWKHCQGRQIAADVQIHWVGHESSCIRVLAQDDSTLPFKTRRILRIENEAYTFVLCPLFI